MAVRGPRIVLGLDYGTTYTGLAWMQRKTDTERLTIERDVFTVKDWNGRVEVKVPTAISYDRSYNGNEQWGNSIDDNSNVIQWTKLELEPRTVTKELTILRKLIDGLDLIRNLQTNDREGTMGDVPRHIVKDSGDVVRDYLAKVSKAWYERMTGTGAGQGQNILRNVPLDIVITHPAQWAYEAKNKTFRAVLGAFSPGMFPTLRNIYLTSEPEACALYTMQDLIERDVNRLIPGECFVLCDAGGGTVDLVSYRLDSIDPFKITRVGGISGGKYGASFVEREFLKLLESRLPNVDIVPQDSGTVGHFVLQPLCRVLLRRFERHKRAFSGEEVADISLPRGAIVAQDREGLQNGVLSLTTAEMKSLFDTCVNGTIDLIARQVIQVEHTENRGIPHSVACVFLSGGFAENQYLVNRVREWAATERIQVIKTEECWAGVVRGAALRGMGIGMDMPAAVKPCPRQYGICVAQTYAEWRNFGARTVVNVYDGRRMVPDQLVWLIRKGDLILPDKPLSTSIDVECTFTRRHIGSGQSLQITIAATDMDSPPANLSRLPRDRNEIAHLDIELSRIPNHELQLQTPRGNDRYYKAVIHAEFQVANKLNVSLKCGGLTLRTYETSL